MPADNLAAAIPEKQKIVGNFVKSVAVDHGAITLTFGNNASKPIEDKKLTLRPAVVPDERSVPIAWVCHSAKVPNGMEARGRDDTDVIPAWLPVACRP
jgi:type IV pilus assembly protein PilA